MGPVGTPGGDQEAHGMDVEEGEPVPLEEGTLVFCRITGHPTWPGQLIREGFAPLHVRDMKQPSMVLLRFFGDASYGWFPPVALQAFADRYASLSKGTEAKKNKVYRKALEEAKEVHDRRSGSEPSTQHHPLDLLDPSTWHRLELGVLQLPPAPTAEQLQACSAQEALAWLRDLAVQPIDTASQQFDLEIAQAAAGLCWMASWGRRTLLSREYERDLKEHASPEPEATTATTPAPTTKKSKAASKGKVETAEPVSKGKKKKAAAEEEEEEAAEPASRGKKKKAADQGESEAAEPGSKGKKKAAESASKGKAEVAEPASKGKKKKKAEPAEEEEEEVVAPASKGKKKKVAEEEAAASGPSSKGKKVADAAPTSQGKKHKTAAAAEPASPDEAEAGAELSGKGKKKKNKLSEPAGQEAAKSAGKGSGDGGDDTPMDEARQGAGQKGARKRTAADLGSEDDGEEVVAAVGAKAGGKGAGGAGGEKPAKKAKSTPPEGGEKQQAKAKSKAEGKGAGKAAAGGAKAEGKGKAERGGSAEPRGVRSGVKAGKASRDEEEEDEEVDEEAPSAGLLAYIYPLSDDTFMSREGEPVLGEEEGGGGAVAQAGQPQALPIPSEVETRYWGPSGAQEAAQKLSEPSAKDQLLYGGKLQVSLPDMLSWLHTLAVGPVVDAGDRDVVNALMVSEPAVAVLRCKELLHTRSNLHRYGEVGALARTAMEDLGPGFITPRTQWPQQPPATAPPSLLTARLLGTAGSKASSGAGGRGRARAKGARGRKGRAKGTEEEEMDEDEDAVIDEEESEDESEGVDDEDDEEGGGKAAKTGRKPGRPRAASSAGRGRGRGRASQVLQRWAAGRGNRGGSGGVNAAGAPGHQVVGTDDDGVPEEWCGASDEEEGDAAPRPVVQVTVDFKDYMDKVPATEAAFQAAFQRWQAERNQVCNDLPMVGPYQWRPFEILQLVATEGGCEAVSVAGRWHAVAAAWQRHILENRAPDAPVIKQVTPNSMVKPLEHHYQKLLAKFEKSISLKCPVRRQTVDKHDDKGKPVLQEATPRKAAGQGTSLVRGRSAEIKKQHRVLPAGGKSGGRYDLDDFDDLAASTPPKGSAAPGAAGKAGAATSPSSPPVSPRLFLDAQAGAQQPPPPPPPAGASGASRVALPARPVGGDVGKGGSGLNRQGSGPVGGAAGRPSTVVGGQRNGGGVGGGLAVPGRAAGAGVGGPGEAVKADPELRRIWLRFPEDGPNSGPQMPTQTRAFFVLSQIIPSLKKDMIAINAHRFPGIVVDLKSNADALVAVNKLKPKLVNLFPEMRLSRQTAPVATVVRVPPPAPPPPLHPTFPSLQGPGPSLQNLDIARRGPPSLQVPTLTTLGSSAPSPLDAAPSLDGSHPPAPPSLASQPSLPMDPRSRRLEAAGVADPTLPRSAAVAPDVFSVAPVSFIPQQSMMQQQSLMQQQLQMPFDPRRGWGSQPQQQQQPQQLPQSLQPQQQSLQQPPLQQQQQQQSSWASGSTGGGGMMDLLMGGGAQTGSTSTAPSVTASVGGGGGLFGTAAPAVPAPVGGGGGGGLFASLMAGGNAGPSVGLAAPPAPVAPIPGMPSIQDSVAMSALANVLARLAQGATGGQQGGGQAGAGAGGQGAAGQGAAGQATAEVGAFLAQLLAKQQAPG